MVQVVEVIVVDIDEICLYIVLFMCVLLSNEIEVIIDTATDFLLIKVMYN